MAKKILLTGISGFIGRNVARQLVLKKDEITALIRPGTSLTRVSEFQKKVSFIQMDLADIPKLRDYLDHNSFDVIIHIGAVRGGRKFPKKIYFDANVNATEQLILNAMKHETDFLFCSSVGVFGAIPPKVPADNKTEMQEDNYYHYTKIRCEALIQKYVLYGLKAAIIRPSITYGPGDFGFPFSLTKMIHRNIFVLPKKRVKIHLSHIDLIVQGFIKLMESNYRSGEAFIVADKEPVNLLDLADFISNEVKGKKFPRYRLLPIWCFRIPEKFFKKLNNELWISRFELISRSWYYDVSETYDKLPLREVHTIPAFKIITDWYKKK